MLDQITDGQLWQQSQKGSAAPTKGYSSSLQSPAASVTHSPMALMALLTPRLPIPTTSHGIGTNPAWIP